MKKLWNNIVKAKDIFMDLWGNPRTRSAMILLFYFFLFLFLISAIRNKPQDVVKKTQTKEETKETFGEIDNYEYEMNILYKTTQASVTYEITGMRYKENHMFHTKESLIPYYVKEDGIYMKKELGLEKTNLHYGVDLYRLSPELLSKMMTHAKLQSRVTYEDTGSKYLYQMSVMEFLILYDEGSPLLATLPTGDILFYVYEKENIVEKIELDFTPYYMLIDPTTTSFMTTITYTNIGKVSEFQIEG